MGLYQTPQRNYYDSFFELGQSAGVLMSKFFGVWIRFEPLST